MRVRIEYTVTVTDDERRAIAFYLGGSDKASRDELKGLYQQIGEMGVEEIIHEGKDSLATEDS